jgi:opacity protein-like surface antigen
MKKVIVFASLLILASAHIISASEGDQLPQSTMEGQTISSQLSSPATDISDTLLPAPSDHQTNDITKPQEDLSHEGITSAPQSKGFLQFLNIFRLFNTKKATQPIQPVISTGELAALKEPGTTSLPDIDRKDNNVQASQAAPDELTHQVLSSDIQGKSTFGFIKPDDTMSLQIPAASPNKGIGAAGLSSSSGIDGRNAKFNNSSQTDPDDISHQSLSTELQGKDIMTIFAAGNTVDNQNTLAQPYSIQGTASPQTGPKNSQTLVAQAGTDDLSHQALAAAIQPDKNRFYFIKTSGAVPILDKSFRNFLDYGASVSIGAGKRINDNLSISVSLDMVMLTGDWSIGGDRKSIEIAAEEWASGIVNTPPTNNQTITPEAQNQPDVNLGTSYHSDAEAVITSSESLKRIDVHTDLYLFPITVNALYKFHPIGKITPYAGGGLGFCMATRDSDSRAIKNKYFNGPEYSIRMNNSQTRNGLLLNLLGGLSIPVYNNLTFIAEGNMTYYDLQTFDPILEISFKTPANPPSIGGSDISTWSYEDPKRFGAFSQEFVGKFTVGLVMPF